MCSVLYLPHVRETVARYMHTRGVSPFPHVSHGKFDHTSCLKDKYEGTLLSVLCNTVLGIG